MINFLVKPFITEYKGTKRFTFNGVLTNTGHHFHFILVVEPDGSKRTMTVKETGDKSERSGNWCCEIREAVLRCVHDQESLDKFVQHMYISNTEAIERFFSFIPDSEKSNLRQERLLELILKS